MPFYAGESTLPVLLMLYSVPSKINIEQRLNKWMNEFKLIKGKQEVKHF